MLLLLNTLIPCVAPCVLSFGMPSSPVLLHIYLFLYFWHCHPYILQHFNGNVFTPVSLIFRYILACKYNAPCVWECASHTPFAARGHIKCT